MKAEASSKKSTRTPRKGDNLEALEPAIASAENGPRPIDSKTSMAGQEETQQQQQGENKSTTPQQQHQPRSEETPDKNHSETSLERGIEAKNVDEYGNKKKRTIEA